MQPATKQEQTFINLVHQRKDTSDLRDELSIQMSMKQNEIEAMFQDLERRGLLMTDMRPPGFIEPGEAPEIGTVVWLKNED
jgi:hypothetical protein